MLRKLGRTQTIEQDLGRDSAPPGQYVTRKFPVLTFGPTPHVDLDAWRFRVSGLVDSEFTLDWQQFTGLERVAVDAAFHCVTQWSRLENTWEGVAFNELMELVNLKPEAGHVMVHCYGGYTTNLALDVLQNEDVLLAYRHDGQPLHPDHGGPLQLVVPKRYGWKSAKWVNGLEFMASSAPGFWEARGYHIDGDPEKKQRFSDELG